MLHGKYGAVESDWTQLWEYLGKSSSSHCDANDVTVVPTNLYSCVFVVKDSGRKYLHFAACLITVSAFVVRVSVTGPHWLTSTSIEAWQWWIPLLLQCPHAHFYQCPVHIFLHMFSFWVSTTSEIKPTNNNKNVSLGKIPFHPPFLSEYCTDSADFNLIVISGRCFSKDIWWLLSGFGDGGKQGSHAETPHTLCLQ